MSDEFATRQDAATKIIAYGEKAIVQLDAALIKYGKDPDMRHLIKDIIFPNIDGSKSIDVLILRYALAQDLEGVTNNLLVLQAVRPDVSLITKANIKAFLSR